MYRRIMNFVFDAEKAFPNHLWDYPDERKYQWPIDIEVVVYDLDESNVVIDYAFVEKIVDDFNFGEPSNLTPEYVVRWIVDRIFPEAYVRYAKATIFKTGYNVSYEEGEIQ